MSQVKYQRTIATETSCTGVGLHTGVETTVGTAPAVIIDEVNLGATDVASTAVDFLPSSAHEPLDMQEEVTDISKNGDATEAY